MTTQIHILNSSDSNPLQHAKVIFTVIGNEGEPNTNTEFRLAPGESKAFWVNNQTAITVTEVFEPKPEK